MEINSAYIVSIGLDSKTLDPESVVASRNSAYGKVVKHYSVVAPYTKDITVPLSNSTTAYGVGGSTKLFQLLRIYKLVRDLIKSGKCDIITSQDTYFLGLVGYILARKHHLGFEVQVLGIEKLNFLRKLLSKFVLKRAGSIRVLSSGLKARLIKEFGIKADRMMLVPIYVDVSSLGFDATTLSSEKKRELEEQNAEFARKYAGRFNIVSVNRLVPIKNISMQLEAIQMLKHEFPQMLLHIVGDGPLQDTLKKEIEDRGITDNVVLEGFKAGTALSPFFTQSDCFVLTSDFEGYGMVVVEAATAGLPIVMTNVGCAGDLIINEKSGMIVPPKDVAAFTEALCKVLDDKTLREALCENAKAAIAQLPSFDTVLEKYKASWQQALDNRL